MKTAASLCAALLLFCAACKTDGNSKGVVLTNSIENLIPNDTVVLTGVRVELLKNTPLYEKLAKEQKLTALDDFAKKTRLDPRRDLKELVVAFTGKDTVVIARGTIADPSALERALEENGAKREQAGKHTLMVSDNGAVAFLGNTLAVAGQTAYLRTLLLGPTGDDSRKKAVLERVAKLPEDKHIWAVAIGGFSPLPLPDTGNLANLGQVFQRLETVTITVDLKDGLSLVAVGQCVKPADAKQLHDLLRGLIGFGRLSTPSDKPELLRFFDGIKVENTDRTVKLNADIPMDLVDLFLNLAGANHPKA